MSRRNFLKTAGLSAVALTLPKTTGAADPSSARRPNVILVMTDDQGYGDLACHGNPVIQTPNLDRLHSESVRLTDFHVCPVCTPTRASLMTGRDTVRTGAWGTTWGRSLLRKDEVTVADVFAAGGYRTGMFGKWHLGDNYPFRPEDRGFHEVLRHGGGGVGQTTDYWGNDYFDDTYFHNGSPTKYTGYCTDVWFDGAMAFIEDSVKNGRPFFCYIPTNAPHGPLNVDEKYSKPYLEKGVPDNRARFYGMITNFDENMARLEKKLDALGIRDNTILIFLTDNGTAGGYDRDRRTKKITGFNAGMRGTKGSYYDGGHRVPCFIRWPARGLHGGRDISEMTAHVDLTPTLIELCGIKQPDGVKFDGMSIAPLLLGKVAELPARSLFIQFRQSHEPPEKWNGAVMNRKWRLVNGTELYNIETDSGQEKDVAAEHPDVVKKLRDDYEAWWAEVSKRFHEGCPIILGSDKENPTCLSGFDWHTQTPWNQRHILNGMEANSYWAVEIERDGSYEFTLRRWPVEVDQPIIAAVPDGKAIAATTARLQIGDIEKEQPIPADAKAVTFTLPMKAGKTRLQTWLIDEKTGESRGAYYVYVKRLG
ncbi:MAG: sulfatase-like hydrolase/transferase [Planctomycetota bacterium]